jgi:transcriptional regulator with XRE-family HTH domain
MPKFGERLRDLRSAAQMKQDALGQRVGLSQGQISKLENGSADLATEALAGLLPRLASALGTTLWGLVGGTEYAEYAAGDARKRSGVGLRQTS